MHPAERLAAYLVSELDADERAAVAAELARDPRLRAQLEAMRRADTALDAAEPTALPEGAEERLRAALAPELEAYLGAASTGAASTGSGAGSGGGAIDEVAQRRARRDQRRRGWQAAAGVAAAVAVGAVVVPGVLTGSGDGDDASDLALDAQDDGAESLMDGGATDEGALPDGDDAPAMDDSADPVPQAEAFNALSGPVVRGGDGMLSDDRLRSSREGPEVDEVLGFVGSRAELEALATAYAVQLGAERDAVQDAVPGAADDGRLDQYGAARADGPVTRSDRDAVGRCAAAVLTPGVVPVAADLGTFDGVTAIAFTLVTPLADDGGPDVRVVVVSRDDCETLALPSG